MYLQFEESILTELESTIVQCTAVGGESPELFNLTLWRNHQLLAQVNGSYTTTPHTYGTYTYTCAVGDIQNTSILRIIRGKSACQKIPCMYVHTCIPLNAMQYPYIANSAKGVQELTHRLCLIEVLDIAIFSYSF